MDINRNQSPQHNGAVTRNKAAAVSLDETTASIDGELQVPFGQLTFDAEGIENPSSRFFSRVIHYPGGAMSGVTIGRGYDMSKRTRQEVVDDLTRSGVSIVDARAISRAAGLTGVVAADFVQAHKGSFPILSLAAQRQLFSDVVVPKYIEDIKRIFVKADVVEKYGKVTWEDLPTPMKEVLLDLRYRGDYTGQVRQVLHPSIVARDLNGFFAVIRNENMWLRLGVPLSRVQARVAATYR